MRSNPTPEEILQALRKTGFLLEQDVATQLQGLGFTTQTGVAYQDPDEGKSREIDVVASGTIYRDPQNHVGVVAEIICECKNPQAPYVFIARPLSEADKRHVPLEYSFAIDPIFERLDNPYRGATRKVAPFTWFGLDEHHYFYSTGIKAVQILRMHQQNKEWRADNAGVFDSLVYPLAKAVSARKKESRSSTHLRPDDWAYVWLRFPVAVIASTFFLIDATEEDPSPREVTHITLTREIKTKHTDGYFMIDFVTRDGLSRFIQDKMLPFAQAVRERVKSSPDEFRVQEPGALGHRTWRRRSSRREYH